MNQGDCFREFCDGLEAGGAFFCLSSCRQKFSRSFLDPLLKRGLHSLKFDFAQVEIFIYGLQDILSPACEGCEEPKDQGCGIDDPQDGIRPLNAKQAVQSHWRLRIEGAEDGCRDWDGQPEESAVHGESKSVAP
jgi:hypothetical protein